MGLSYFPEQRDLLVPCLGGTGLAAGEGYFKGGGRVRRAEEVSVRLQKSSPVACWVEDWLPLEQAGEGGCGRQGGLFLFHFFLQPHVRLIGPLPLVAYLFPVAFAPSYK